MNNELESTDAVVLDARYHDALAMLMGQWRGEGNPGV